jgi:hypothetical protein
MNDLNEKKGSYGNRLSLPRLVARAGDERTVTDEEVEGVC